MASFTIPPFKSSSSRASSTTSGLNKCKRHASAPPSLGTSTKRRRNSVSALRLLDFHHVPLKLQQLGKDVTKEAKEHTTESIEVETKATDPMVHATEAMMKATQAMIEATKSFTEANKSMTEATTHAIDTAAPTEHGIIQSIEKDTVEEVKKDATKVVEVKISDATHPIDLTTPSEHGITQSDESAADGEDDDTPPPSPSTFSAEYLALPHLPWDRQKRASFLKNLPCPSRPNSHYYSHECKQYNRFICTMIYFFDSRIRPNRFVSPSKFPYLDQQKSCRFEECGEEGFDKGLRGCRHDLERMFHGTELVVGSDEWIYMLKHLAGHWGEYALEKYFGKEEGQKFKERGEAYKFMFLELVGEWEGMDEEDRKWLIADERKMHEKAMKEKVEEAERKTDRAEAERRERRRERERYEAERREAERAKKEGKGGKKELRIYGGESDESEGFY